MSNFLMVNYMQGEKLVSELSNSNPNHINRIISELDDAVDSLSGVPGTGGIISGLNGVCDICTEESKRYEGIAGVMDAFYKEVQATDMALKEGIHKLFQEEYVNKDYKFMLDMVKNSANITILSDISKIAEEMELSVEEMTEMVALQSYIQDLQKMTPEERKKELEGLQGIKNPSLWQSAMITNTKGKNDAELGKLLGSTGDAWTLYESYIITKRGGELAVEEIALLKKQVTKFKSKISGLASKINKYTTADSYKYKRIAGWENKIDEIKGKLNYDVETGKIKNHNEKIGKVILGMQVVAVVGGDFYDNFVHGMDWDDLAEDVIVDGIEIASSAAVGVLVQKGVALVSSKAGGTIGTALGGPIGTVIGIGIGGAVGAIYEGVKEPLRDAIKDIGDWWEQCWW